MTTPNWTLKLFNIRDLKDHPKNPRVLTKEQYGQLKKSLDKFGLIDKPICTPQGLLIGGHQRKNVLKESGVKEVECYVPDRELTEKEIEELNIRLNKGGEFDWEALANEYDQLDLVDWGFQMAELMDQESEDPSGEKAPEFSCPTCGKKTRKKIEV